MLKPLLAQRRDKGTHLAGSVSKTYTLLLVTILCTLMHGYVTGQSVKYALNHQALPPTILIDAGHGGKDSGCLGRHSMEKDIALALSLRIGHVLKRHLPTAIIKYTRTDDRFVPLHDRSQMANEVGADLFVSVHCNGVKNKLIRGTETYVMGLHTADENLAVAKRENQSILLEQDYDSTYNGYDPDSPLGHILLSAYQNHSLAESIEIADKVERAMSSVMSRSRGVKQAGFVVLRETTMPSILIEAGFLTNTQDEALLTDPHTQELMAQRIGQEIASYLINQSPVTIATTTPPPTGRPLPVSVQEETAITILSEPKYKLQIGAFAKALSEEQLADYEVFPYMQVIEQDGLYKVQVGGFESLADAVQYQSVMRSRGYHGAFVVANTAN